MAKKNNKVLRDIFTRNTGKSKARDLLIPEEDYRAKNIYNILVKYYSSKKSNIVNQMLDN